MAPRCKTSAIIHPISVSKSHHPISSLEPFLFSFTRNNYHLKGHQLFTFRAVFSTACLQPTYRPSCFSPAIDQRSKITSHPESIPANIFPSPFHHPRPIPVIPQFSHSGCSLFIFPFCLSTRSINTTNLTFIGNRNSDFCFVFASWQPRWKMLDVDRTVP